jgi:predicted ferric reductase
MQVKKYNSEIVSIFNPFPGLYTLELRSLGGKFKYYPGQFLHLAIDDKYDGSGQWPESRCFSMQSNPDESTVKITYSVKGKFTSEMEQTLRVGSHVLLKLPYGDLFTQKHNKENTVFIAGGTGITPFLSLFTDASFVAYKKPVLYAGFKNRGMHLYKDQLESAMVINSELEVQIIYENESGIIDIGQLLRHSDKKSSFYISGPPIMIRSFKNFLLGHGLTSDQIKTDDWE